MKQRGVLLIVMVVVLASFVIAPGVIFCGDDIDCAPLGVDYACDLNVGECVQLDFPDEVLTDEELFAEIDGMVLDENFTLDENATQELFVPAEPSIDDKIAVLQNRFVVLDTRVSEMESSGSGVVIQDLQSQLLELRTQVESLNTQVQLMTYDTQQNLDQALAGLAVLQDELSGTQSQLSEVEEEIQAREKKAAFNRMMATIAIIAMVFVALTYYILSHNKGHVPKTDVPGEIRVYITKEIQKGKHYGQIRQDLLKAGWNEKHIKEAYEQTSRKNYEQYLQSQGKSGPKSHFAPHQTKKIISITLLTIGILSILIFFVSNSTGQAYYLGMSEGEFAVNAKEIIENNVANNAFYGTLTYANLCVQVTQDNLDTSYRIIVTPSGGTVIPAVMPCAADPSYDFAVKFTNWNTFSTLLGGINCFTATAAHATGGVYVLPSRYVAPGFSTTSLDYSTFCPAITLCASQTPVATLMGSIGC
jgi:hypothetical protein